MSSGTSTFSDGDLIAVSMDFTAYVGGSFSLRVFDIVNDVTQLPCLAINTLAQVGIPNVVLVSADGAYGVLQEGGWGIGDSEVSFLSGGSPNEHGNQFVCPATMKVNGIWCRQSIANSGATPFYVGIYTSTGTTVVERLVGSEEYAHDINERRLNTYRIPETVLDGGQTYHVTVRAASTTNAVGLEHQAVSSYSLTGALPGGSSVRGVSRSGGSGAFSDYTATIGHFTIGVAISAIDDGTGSGWIHGTGTTGNTLKITVDPSAVAAADISGVVFASPEGTNIVGAKIGEFTGEVFEVVLEDGKAILTVPVSAFGGTGLLLTDTPVVLVRNSTHTTGMVRGTVVNT
jgi:hypothetical protein